MKIIIDKMPSTPRQCGFAIKATNGKYRCTIAGNAVCESTSKCNALAVRDDEKANDVPANKTAMQNATKIADVYGYESQSRQCVEEMAELTQAISKIWRKHHVQDAAWAEQFIRTDAPELTNLKEEIADVQIMLWQMMHLIKMDNDEAERIITEKIDRQLNRIKENNEAVKGYL